jgi:RHS repeat-associated protein
MTDSTNRVWQYNYDGGGQLTSFADPLGHSAQYGYDSQSRMTSITDKRGNLAKQVVFDSSDRVVEQRFADGGVERYSYGLSGGVVTHATVTDAVGRATTKRFNAGGYVLEYQDALGQTVKYQRNLTTNLVTSATGPCGCLDSQRQYNAQGLPTLIVDRKGQTTALEYEPVYNKITRITDALGRVTIYAYDINGNMTSMTNALNQTTTYTYDSFGQRTSVTDPLGNTTMFEYDVKGNLTAIGDPLGNRYTREYDNLGRLTATVDPLGRRRTFQYDSRSRVITKTDLAGATTTYEYDNNSNVTAMVNALSKRWARTYDNKNRLLSTTDPVNRTTRYRYNTKGEMIAAISPSGRTTRYTYDARGRVTSVTDPLGGVVRFAYDNRENLVSLKDQRGNETVYRYDELDRQVARRDPLGKVSSVVYDAVGNVIETTDRLGRRTHTSYDALDRPATITYVDAAVTYTYDAAGRTTRIDDTQSGSIQWTYDNADRLTAETTPQGTISYTYNAASQRVSMIAADRPPVTYSYDMAGRLQSIAQSGETFAYSYDPLSRRLSLQRPNNVLTTYSYDDANRLTQLIHTNTASVVLEDLQYSYNSESHIVSITSLASASLLPSAKTAGSADAANRISQFGQANYNHDDHGQVKSKADTLGQFSYQWDARGRLANVVLPNGNTVTYTYDAFGRRVGRSESGGTTSFIYDGSDVVAERSGVSVTDYLNGLGLDNKLLQANTNSGRLYFLQDRIGSTIGLANDAGVLMERLQYSVYGTSVGSSLTRYGFTGREVDISTGLMYFRARWYEPEQSRFITEDPLEIASGLNFYRYAEGNPLSYSDPLGLDSIYVEYRNYPVDTGYGFHLPLGHAGVVAVDPKTGKTTYYEYGRYDPEKKGVVQGPYDSTKVEFDKNGNPTADSLKKLYDDLSKRFGKGMPVDPEYHSETDYEDVIDYVEKLRKDKNRPDYDLSNNNCKTFGRAAATACNSNRKKTCP